MPFRFRLPFSAEVRNNLIAAGLIILFVNMLEHWGWLSGFENTALDSFLLAGSSRPSNKIFIVGITEDDYRDIFQGRSPLDVAKVQWILTLIQQGSPDVIGVDLDTSPSEYGKGKFPSPYSFEEVSRSTPITLGLPCWTKVRIRRTSATQRGLLPRKMSR